MERAGGQTGMDEAARSAAAARWDRICFHYGLVGWKTGGRTQDPAWSLEYQGGNTTVCFSDVDSAGEGAVLHDHTPPPGGDQEHEVPLSSELQSFYFLTFHNTFFI